MLPANIGTAFLLADVLRIQDISDGSDDDNILVFSRVNSRLLFHSNGNAIAGFAHREAFTIEIQQLADF